MGSRSTGRVLGLLAIGVLVLGERQTWQLDTTESGTHVSVVAEMTGLASWLLRRRLTERLQTVVVSVLDLLRLEAEVRTVEAQEEAAKAAEDEGRAPAHD